MPDGKVHKVVGAVAGAGYASCRAKGQARADWVVEVMGGAGGGYVGGQLPDIFEPAISSWHRDVFHSCAAGAAVISLKSVLAAWEAFCRERAEQYRARSMMPVAYKEATNTIPLGVDLVARLLLIVAEFLWRFLAGFLNGLAAGYVSHLTLDALTPRSIPLVTAEF